MNDNSYKNLSIVIPVYNSEETIAKLVDQLYEELGSHFKSIEVVMVNDFSADDSEKECLKACDAHPDKPVKYFKMSRNFGEHNAVMCGLNQTTGDCVAIIDDDFQNPPSEIIKLVKELEQGHDVVFSYYECKKHNLFRNLGSKFNDLVASMMLKKPRGLYLSSFKVLNRFLVDTITEYSGPYPYVDGLILRSTRSIGQRLCRHEERCVGKSNYTLTKLLRLWLNMFTGYSVLPLRISAIMGIAISAFAVLLTLFFFISKITGGLLFVQDIPAGWASLIITVTFFSGINLLLIGMVGEYLGRVFLTINRQPQFIIRKSYEYQAKEKKNDE